MTHDNWANPGEPSSTGCGYLTYTDTGSPGTEWSSAYNCDRPTGVKGLCETITPAGNVLSTVLCQTENIVNHRWIAVDHL